MKGEIRTIGLSPAWRKTIRRRRKDFREGRANPVSAAGAIRQAQAVARKAPKCISVKKADYVSGYKLRMRFNDDGERVIDFGPFLRKSLHPQIEQYRDLKKFKRFHLDHGDLMWGDYEMIFPVWDLYHGEI